MENTYGLDFSVKSFAVSNDFVTRSNKACYKLGQQLIPFCFYATEEQKQHGVLDFATFTGFLSSDKLLLDEIAEYRKNVFSASGIFVDTNDEVKKKLLLYDYLLSISVCYVEVPKFITKDGQATPTYDKFLCTRNPNIMAIWMGSSAGEMQAKYSARIKTTPVDFNDNCIRFAKLSNSSKGNSISIPRKVYDVEKMRCIPLYMLYAFIEGFKPILDSKILKFSYLKDNGTLRELVSTTSESIIRDYYDDNVVVASTLGNVDINTVKQGGMMLSSKMNRGYIKIPELGSSIYDATGVRSLNIARVLKVEEVAEADRTFIKVDLNSVITNFDSCLDYIINNSPDVIYDVYKDLTKDEEVSFTSPILCKNACMDYVRGREVYFSTSFLRQLHMFIISHPDWFPLYSGTKATTVVSSKSHGVEVMDF